MFDSTVRDPTPYVFWSADAGPHAKGVTLNRASMILNYNERLTPVKVKDLKNPLKSVGSWIVVIHDPPQESKGREALFGRPRLPVTAGIIIVERADAENGAIQTILVVFLRDVQVLECRRASKSIKAASKPALFPLHRVRFR